MVIQAHACPLDDAVTSYGLLGSPGKRLHRDGNYVIRTYQQLFCLTPQLFEQHYIMPCSFQSCVPLKQEVARGYFDALDDCHAVFAGHFGHASPPSAPSPERPVSCTFEQQSPAEAALTRAIGLGFGSPSMRIGQLVAHLQSNHDDMANCPDALVSLLMSALSMLGPHATVLEAFSMARDVVARRDDKLKEAEERIKFMATEVDRLAMNSPQLSIDATGNTSSVSAWGSQPPTLVDPNPSAIPKISLPTAARDRLMQALQLTKGPGGVSIPLPIDLHGPQDQVGGKLAKLVTASLMLRGVPKERMEQAKAACSALPQESPTRTRIEVVARWFIELSNDKELYLACVGCPTERSAQGTAMTTFYHLRRDGRSLQVPLCHVLETERLGLVVLNHQENADNVFWYKQAA
jgi:hypothetical protein